MATEVQPQGVVFQGECEVQLHGCTARTPRPITAVIVCSPRRQVNVCGHCLAEMIRQGEWRVPGAKVAPRYDVAVLDANGRPVLVAEVAAPSSGGEPSMWATEVRRNLLLHSAVPEAPYFMLLLAPDHAYLWVEHKRPLPDAQPDYQIDTGSVLRQMVDRADEAQPLWRRTEQAAAEWLGCLLRDGSTADWYRKSGLAEALEGGRVVTEAAA